MIYFLQLATLFMKFLYGGLKWLPVKNKVVFLSRQVNEPSVDYLYLAKELKAQDSSVEIIMLCMRIEKNPKAMAQFSWLLLKSLYHLATARVCILDTYWPAVSLLNHKKELTIIQIWHAMGKIKQSGHKTLNREGGRGKKFAQAMKMHENYDVIVAGAKAWNPYYCESFNVEEGVLLNVGLPRIDYLLNERLQIAEKIFEVYPQLKEKPIILYAPTFRRTGNAGWEKLLDAVDFETFNLVVKSHPNQKLEYDSPYIFELPEFSALDTLAVADYLITDYSAIAVEAAALPVKTYYYVYDYEKYSSKNGLNIDLYEEMPGCVFEDAGALIKSLASGYYNDEALQRYRQKFLPHPLGQSTKQIADRIMKSLEGKHEHIN